MNVTNLEVCDVCGAKHSIADCPELGFSSGIPIPAAVSRARVTLPANVSIKEDVQGGIRIIAKEPIMARVKLGILEARRTTVDISYPDTFVLKVLVVDSNPVWLDTSSEADCNWLCLVPCAKSAAEQNVMVTQIGVDIHFLTNRAIAIGEELTVWYAPSYARKLERPVVPDGKTIIMLGLEAATFGEHLDVTNIELIRIVTPEQGKNKRISTISQNTSKKPAAGACKKTKRITAKMLNEQEQFLEGDISEFMITAVKEENMNDDDHLQELHIVNEVVESDTNIEGVANFFSGNSAKFSEKASLAARRSSRATAGKRSSGWKLLEDLQTAPSKRKLLGVMCTNDSSSSAAQVSPVKEDVITLRIQGDETVTKNLKALKSSHNNITWQKRDGALEVTMPKAKYETLFEDILKTDESVSSENNDGAAVDENMAEDGEVEASSKQQDDCDIQPHKCGECGLCFTSPYYLERHFVVHMHTFQCRVCEQVFSRKQTLLYHMNHEHKDMADDTVTEQEEQHKNFICYVCDKLFAREKSFLKHVQTHEKGNDNHSGKTGNVSKPFSDNSRLSHLVTVTANGFFRCNICSKGTIRRLAMKRHLRLHTDELKCATCSKLFTRREEFEHHQAVCFAAAETAAAGIVRCDKCDETFTDANLFAVHSREHTHPFQCDKCNRRFLREKFLCHHRCGQDERDINGCYECQFCHKKFNRSQNLNRHVATHGEPKFECKRCGRKFHREASALSEHMCRDEQGNKIYPAEASGGSAVICPICGKKFTKASNATKHMKRHGEKSEVCNICGKPFHLKTELKEHCKYVHPNANFPPQSCPHCHKMLKSRNSVRVHILQFHTNSARYHACPTCGRKFLQKGNMNKHMLTHSDKRTYSCDMCSSTFKLPEHLRRHKLWHTDGARYACTHCARNFVMPFELRMHYERFHSRTRYVCRYCNTVCRHAQSMKRHLIRRHLAINEWQTDTLAYIKSLMVELAHTDDAVNEVDVSDQAAEAFVYSNSIYSTNAVPQTCDVVNVDEVEEEEEYTIEDSYNAITVVQSLHSSDNWVITHTVA